MLNGCQAVAKVARSVQSGINGSVPGVPCMVPGVYSGNTCAVKQGEHMQE